MQSNFVSGNFSGSVEQERIMGRHKHVIIGGHAFGLKRETELQALQAHGTSSNVEVLTGCAGSFLRLSHSSQEVTCGCFSSTLRSFAASRILRYHERTIPSRPRSILFSIL